MASGDFILRLVNLVQIGIGVLGNTFLLSTYASPFCTAPAQKPMHLVVTNMAVTNFLVLLFKGIPQMIFIWGVTHILGNTDCELVYYIRRVARGLSLCTTCLLSSFQAVTISPRTGSWSGVRDGTLKNIVPSCLLCCISNLLINIFVPMHLQPSPYTHNSIKIRDYGLCSSKNPRTTTVARYTLLMTFSDAVFLGLMVGANVYMVVLLHRCQQTVRHIHTINVSSRFSSEAKATQLILLLANTLIVFYSINSMLTIYNIVSVKSPLWLQPSPRFWQHVIP